MQTIVNALLSKIRQYNPELDDAQINSRRYGLEVLLNELSKVLIYLLIFSLFSLAGYYLLSTVIFSTIRLHTGGYHSKSYLGCLIITFIMFAVIIFSGQYIDLTIAERSILLGVSLIITIIFAPVRHKNVTRKNLAKARSFKLKSVLFVVFWGGFTYLLDGAWGATAVITIFIEAIMQPLGRQLNPIEKAESIG